MATALETLAAAAKGEGCLGKADDDEPVFVLRAKDLTAPKVVRWWAASAAKVGARPEKVQSALKDADEMEAWQARTKKGAQPI